MWARAAAEHLVIVSKDADFHQRASLFGAPPKVIWVRVGNCSTQDVAGLLRRHASAIREFLAADAAFLSIG